MPVKKTAYLLAAFVAVPSGCSGDGPREPVGSTGEAIMGGKPATQYPEAVYVLVAGFIPCSGVVLAPRVVLTAGHCKATNETYIVTAPHAGNQVAHGNADWSPFTGEAAKTPDVRLIFLETPIHLASYPVLSKTEVPAGTEVVDLGRTLNGSIDDDDYVSPPVKILGPATRLGFPFNYEAQPDISEDGDSGGPIELVESSGSAAHTVVGIVDTDTIEQDITEATPIDLFARIDVVYADIEAQIASHGTDAGSSRDAGGDGGSSAPPAPSQSGGGGCTASPSPVQGGVESSFFALGLLGLHALRARRRGRDVAGRPRAAVVFFEGWTKPTRSEPRSAGRPGRAASPDPGQSSTRSGSSSGGEPRLPLASAGCGRR
jgi:hypothetical protein